MVYYVDGKWLEPGEAAAQPEDRGYQFGDGIYEVVRIYRGKLYQWEAHLARLMRSGRELKLDLPLSGEELRQLAEELMVRSGLSAEDDAIIYLQVTRGVAPRQFEFPAEARPVLSAYVRKKERPLRDMERGISAAVVPDLRWLRVDVKSLNLLGAVLAKQEAKERGADEAILHRDGTVTEASAANVFVVKDGRLHTHPATNLILHGITRQTVIELAGQLNIPVAEEPFDLAFLKGADEVFITGTTVEVMPIVSIDGQPVGNGQVGSVVRRLQEAFEANILNPVL